MNFKEGDIIVKSRQYTRNTYCRYGGNESDVPIGTQGVITDILADDRIIIQFYNDNNWAVHMSEIDIVKNTLKSILEDL